MVSSPRVAERWHDPSALAEFSVGGVAGHTYLAARILERRLDTVVPDDPEVVDALERYRDFRIVDKASLEDEAHRESDTTASTSPAGVRPRWPGSSTSSSIDCDRAWPRNHRGGSWWH
jgi:hypothetical protein